MDSEDLPFTALVIAFCCNTVNSMTVFYKSSLLSTSLQSYRKCSSVSNTLQILNNSEID